MGKCSVEECKGKPVGRGLCASHYYGAKRRGILDEIAPKNEQCEWCGGAMSSDHYANARFCCRACKDSARTAQQSAERTARRIGRVCVQCGEPIAVTASGKALTCSKACAVKYQNAKKQQIREQDRPPRPPCDRCGALIPEDRRYGSKFCSYECKKKTYDERWRAKASGYNRQYLYGLTSERYAALLEAQGNRCAICRTEEWGGNHGAPHVDHYHDGQQVRGLLCNNCNNGLGRFQDDVVRLRAAIAYLEKPLEG